MLADLNQKINYLRTKKDVPLERVKNVDTTWAMQIAFWIAFILFFSMGIFGQGSPLMNIVMMVTIFPMLFSSYYWMCFGISIASGLGFYIIYLISAYIINTVNYSKRDKRHKELVARRDHSYNSDLVKASELEEEKAGFENEKAQTEAYLKRLYSMDILFPKYRNMVAVITIYEYLVSGRCDTLTLNQGVQGSSP